jgi:hypothetical protein
VEHKLLRVEQKGRHRYFRLADPAIAEVMELLAIIAPASAVRSLHESELGRAVRAARLCYNHFAGKFGVDLSQALVDKEILTKVDAGYLVTADGERWLQQVGIECSALKEQGKIFAPHHIDWSERFYHVAGPLGAALARRFLDLGWVRRVPNNRAVRLTEEGEQAFLEKLGLYLTADKETILA